MPPLRFAIGVRVVDGVPSAGQRLVVAVAATGTWWEVFDRADLQPVAAVGALEGAGGDVAAGGNGIGHEPIIADPGFSALSAASGLRSAFRGTATPWWFFPLEKQGRHDDMAGGD